MSKVKIKYSIKNSNETICNECLGILNNKKISYCDNKIMTTFNIDTLELIRKSDDYEIKILFNNNICYINNNGNELKIELKIKNLKKEINKIYIEYILSNEIYSYKLEYEVI